MIPLNILSRAYNTPLMITPEKWSALMGVVTRGQFDLGAMHEHLDAGLVASAARPMPHVSQDGGSGIAIVSVCGSLVARSSGFSGGSGLRSYASIKNDINSALSDPEIGGILLDIDSHGGESAGCFALADFIRDASGRKPIFSYINESSYSAGYAIAAATERIYAGPTSGGGSVGVFMVHVDKSKMFEKEGVAYEYIYSGAKKIDGNPNGPLDKRVRGELQEKVDALRSIFAGKVDLFRGLKEGSALSTEAGVFMGQELIDIGFADSLATFDDALNELRASITNRQIGRKPNMTTKQRMAALIENNEDAPAALAELGWVKAEAMQASVEPVDVSAMVAEGIKEQAVGMREAFVAEVTSIAAMCALAGIPDLAVALLQDGVVTAEAAKPLILAEKAAVDGKVKIASTVGPESKKPNNFVEFMQKNHSAGTK